jgi:hypothetical protein
MQDVKMYLKAQKVATFENLILFELDVPSLGTANFCIQ